MKISSKMKASTWKALQEESRENNRSISGLLCEAVEEYLARRRLRETVLKAADESMRENEELGALLAK